MRKPRITQGEFDDARQTMDRICRDKGVTVYPEHEEALKVILGFEWQPAPEPSNIVKGIASVTNLNRKEYEKDHARWLKEVSDGTVRAVINQTQNHEKSKI